MERPQTDRHSLSPSVNLVHWTKYRDTLSSRTLLVGPADAPPGFSTGLMTEKNKDEGGRACLSLGSAIDNSSVQLDQEEQPVHLPSPVRTIILDFSMVQFVDLMGSELLRQVSNPTAPKGEPKVYPVVLYSLLAYNTLLHKTHTSSSSRPGWMRL